MGKFILFDFDGVIADSFAIASALAHRVCKQNTPERYRSAFEGNIYNTYPSDGSRPDHKEQEGCEHGLNWWDEYEKSFATVTPFDGVCDVIRDLSKGYSLVIISSGSRRFIDPFLEHNGIADRFVGVLDVDAHTHKTKKIEMIFEKHGITSADCVFVTDTLGDIREAAHHSIGSIAVTWGFHSRETLERGVPFRIINSPREIPDAVAEYFSRSIM